MTKKPLRATPPSEEIYPGLEAIANKFLAKAADSEFKFPDGAPLAHGMAMALSSAISLRRIADMLELWFNEKNSNSGIAQLRGIASSLRKLDDTFQMPPSKDLLDVLERIAQSNEYAASLMPTETALQKDFFGEGPDGAGKNDHADYTEEQLRNMENADRLAADAFKPAPIRYVYGRGAPKTSWWQRIFSFREPYDR